MDCRHFVPFRELFRDEHEPADKGLCTWHVEFEKWNNVDVAVIPVVSKEDCYKCVQQKQNKEG